MGFFTNYEYRLTCPGNSKTATPCDCTFFTVMAFFTTITERAVRINSLLCVGLDPHNEDLEKISSDVSDYPAATVTFCNAIVKATAEVALCYKPNFAFFEALGHAGLAALEKVHNITHLFCSLLKLLLMCAHSHLLRFCNILLDMESRSFLTTKLETLVALPQHTPDLVLKSLRLDPLPLVHIWARIQ